MRKSLIQLHSGLLLVFFTMTFSLIFWGIFRREALLEREDNPRNVIFAESIVRGQIYDRNGNLLAQTRIDPETGRATRIYSAPENGTAIGYFSYVYGEGGVESAYNDLLTGETIYSAEDRIVQDILHRSPIGAHIYLTIDESLQRYVSRQLSPYTGAIVVVNARSGEILAMSSSPTYDPNQLDENWDLLSEDSSAPLVNRVTQGLYHPGAMLQPLVFSIALEQGLIANMDSDWDGPRTIVLDDQRITCLGNVPIQTISDAMIWGCPGPVQELADTLDTAIFNSRLQKLGLFESASNDLTTESMELDNFSVEIHQSVAGQGDLTLTPLHMASIFSVFANQGSFTEFHIGRRVLYPDSTNIELSISTHHTQVFSPEIMNDIQASLFKATTTGVAQSALLEEGFPVYSLSGTALSGPAGSRNTWFSGYIIDENNTPYVIVILLEDIDDTSLASSVGGNILKMLRAIHLD